MSLSNNFVSDTLSSCFSIPENMSRSSGIYGGRSDSTTSSLLRDFNFPPPPSSFPSTRTTTYKTNGLVKNIDELNKNNIYLESYCNGEEQCNLLNSEDCSYPFPNKFVSSFSAGQIAANASTIVLNRRARKSSSSRSCRKKPVPKPRTCAQHFDHKTLPAR